jgi:hypothetical protein
MRHAGAHELERREPAPRPKPRLRVVEAEAARAEAPPAERRTITITGNPVPAPRRRSPAHQHIASRPDRVALWAVLLGIFLALVAAATANAAV